MLNYNLKGTGVDISDELRSYVEKRLERARKFLNEEAAHVAVELEYRPLREGEHYRAEFTARQEGATYRAEEWGESMHAAIDLAIEEFARELRRDKKKRLHLWRRGAARAKEFIRGWRSSA